MPVPCRGLLPSYYCSFLACWRVISTHVGHISCLANMFVHKQSGATEAAVYCSTESVKFSRLHFSLNPYCLTNNRSSKVKPKLSLSRSTNDKCHRLKMVTNVKIRVPKDQDDVRKCLKDSFLSSKIEKHRKYSLLRSWFWTLLSKIILRSNWLIIAAQLSYKHFEDFFTEFWVFCALKLYLLIKMIDD